MEKVTERGCCRHSGTSHEKWTYSHARLVLPRTWLTGRAPGAGCTTDEVVYSLLGPCMLSRREKNIFTLSRVARSPSLGSTWNVLGDLA